MRVLFDTSILVAAMVQTHSKHEAAVAWMRKVYRDELSLLISSHSLLECYSILTRLPVTPRISPNVAFQLINDNLKKAEVISLSPSEYASLLQECVRQNFSGGIVYDALIYKAAIIAKAQHLLTLNGKDFQRFTLEHDFILAA